MSDNSRQVADFGAGKAMAVTSMCQRFATLAHQCELCVQGCPTAAITAREHSLAVSDDCMRCGACLEICPMGALSCTRQTIQDINRKLLDVTLERNNLIISCTRTPLESKIDDNAAGDKSKGALEGASSNKSNAVTSGNAGNNIDDAPREPVFVVPCLGMLGAEVWFSLLNEMDITALEHVNILLPPNQCQDCPANSKGTIEAIFERAIDTAEIWSGATVGLLCSIDEVPIQPDYSLRGVIKAVDRPADRREAFTGIFKSIKNAWDEIGNAENRTLIEVRAKRDRKQAYKNTRLGDSLSAASGTKSSAAGVGGKTTPRGIVPPTRYILVDALGRNPEHASSIILETSATTDSQCTRCGSCIDACAIHARRFELVCANEEQVKDDAENVNNYHVQCDSLYCVSCKRCLAVCEAKAIHFVEISGKDFLLA